MPGRLHFIAVFGGCRLAVVPLDNRQTLASKLDTRDEEPTEVGLTVSVAR